MSEFEIFFGDESSQYGEGILFDKYGDRYSLLSAQKSRTGGTIYKRWAYPQGPDKKPKEKAIPMGVRLGTRDQAIKTLEMILAELKITAPGKGQDPPF